MSDFKSKLESIHFGTPRKPRVDVVDGNKRVEVIHEDDGGTAGIHTYKSDGRVAAEAFPRAPELGTIE